MAQAKTVITPEDEEKIHDFATLDAAERLFDFLIEGAHSDWTIADHVEKRERAWYNHHAILNVKASMILIAKAHRKRVGLD